MQFRIITSDEAGRFDAFIKSTPNGHIFQSYEWGEVKKPVWEPLRVVLEEDGRIVAAASVLKRQVPLLRKSLFYLPRGPVLEDWHDTRIIASFSARLRELARAHRAVFVKIDPCIQEEEFLPARALQSAGFTQAPGTHDFGGLQPRYTFRLDISGDLDTIMKNFPKKIRYKVKFGYNKGLTFEEPGEDGLAHFIDVMRQTGRRGDFVTRTPDYYRKVFRNLNSCDAINLTLGRFQGEVIVAGITMAFGDKAWAIYGGQLDSHRNLYAYHAMIWERIKWAKSKGARWFDFYGVPGKVGEDHPLHGIYHFKKSFGGDFYAFVGEKDLVVSPFYYWLWTRCFPAVRNLMLQFTKLGRLFRSGGAGPARVSGGRQ